MQEQIKVKDMKEKQDDKKKELTTESLGKMDQRNEKLNDEIGRLRGLLSAEEKTSEKLKEDNGRLESQVKGLENELKTERSSSGKKSDEKLGMLEKTNRELQKQIEDLNARLGKKQGELDNKIKEVKQLEKFRLNQTDSQQKLKAGYTKLKKQLNEIKQQQTELKSSVSVDLRSFSDTFMLPLRKHVGQIAGNMATMLDSFKQIQVERRRLHNLVLELKGNIRVFARIRPISENELHDEPKKAGTKTVTYSEETKVAIFNDYDSRKKWFEFDKVFWPSSTQVEVFEEAEPLATSVLDGFNVCIFAYGQTGSGKTFTMRGPREDPGLYSRVMAALFKLREEKRTTNKIRISVVITEIYNEQLRDLLSDAGGSASNNRASINAAKDAGKLDIKLQPDGSVVIPGVEELEVRSVGEVVQAMNKADKNRATASTDMNEHSSRSHQIVTLRTENESMETGNIYYGKIHLIDLAGSENVGKSGATGTTLKEAQNINKSLSALGDVIQALQNNKNGHIPYRNSKLTMMLKDSLGGDSKMLMIVQCSPAQCNVTETLSTLTFASRARQVELGKAKRNVKNTD